MPSGLTAAYARGLESQELHLGPPAADGMVAVSPYDFQRYRNLYDDRFPDAPRYLLTPALASAEDLEVRVWFRRNPNQAEESVDVTVPGGWAAGRGIAVPISGGAAGITSALRLTRLQPQPPASQAAGAWGMTALLGNLAKLLWVVSGEHDELAIQLADLTAQRNAASA